MKGLFGFGKKGQNETKSESQEKPAQSSSPSSGEWLVQYDRKGCIGAGTCGAVNPERWRVLDTKKAELKGSKSGDGVIFELSIGDDEFEKMKMAAEGCPKNVIHIINKETGEKII